MDLKEFDLDLDQRPHLRGRLHQIAAFASVAGLVVLVTHAETAEARAGAWIFGITQVGLYATSSSYHVFARTPRARRVMQRADHSMIYVLMAGTATPVALMTLGGALQVVVLTVMWLAAAIAVFIIVVWFDRFRRLGSILYVVLGWACLALLPALWSHKEALWLLAVSGVLYTVGAVLFAKRWPRWGSRWFGYHEVWHTLGVVAGVLCFVANLGLLERR